MASRESIGLVAMTLALFLVVGGVGGFMLLRYADETGFGGRSVETLVSRGQAAANREDFAGALKLFNEAIEADPRSADPYLARAELYLRMSDHPSAHDDYTAAISRGEDSPRALIGRARSREQMDDLPGAIEDYGRLLAVDPEHTGALRGRARLQKRLGNYAAAVTDFERAVAIDPGLNRIDADLAWAHWGAGDYEAALVVYDRTVRTRRAAMHDRFGRGVTLYHLGRLEAAKEDLVRASDSRSSGHVYAAYYLWLTMIELGERQEADRILVEARDVAGDNWPAQIGRFLSGEITEEQLIDQAAAGTWRPASHQLCEAHFYAGALRLIDGDRAAAADHFRRAVATGVNNFYEYFSAMEELRKLEKQP